MRCFLLFTLLTFVAIANSQKLNWVEGHWGDYCSEVVTDSDNNVIVVGTEDGSFGPDMFIHKYDSIGNLLWDQVIAEQGRIFERDIAVDMFDNIYVVGQFFGVTDFDPSFNDYEISGGQPGDSFIAKFTSSGDLIWVVEIESSNIDLINAIEMDSYSGNYFYVTGFFEGVLDFPGTSIPSLVSNGNQDMYLAKYNLQGDCIWAYSAGVSTHDFGEDLATDTNGDILLTGKTGGGTDLDFSTDSLLLDSSELNLLGMEYRQYVAKYDSNGVIKWAHSLTKDLSHDYRYDRTRVEVGLNGDVFLAGSFQRDADLDPGLDTAYINSLYGNVDLFLLKLSQNGDYLWHNVIAAFNPENVYDLELVNGHDPVILGSYFNGIINFGTGNCEVLEGMSGDLFIAKYDGLVGDYSWHGMFGMNSGQNYNSLSIDKNNRIIVVGALDGDFDPDLGPGIISHSEHDHGEAWIASYTDSTILRSNFSIESPRCEGSCLDFSDCSVGNNISSWNWSFDGATSNNSSDQNPSAVCFLNEGTFNVELIVSNGVEVDTVVKTITIYPEHDINRETKACFGYDVITADGSVLINLIDTMYYTSNLISLISGCDSIVNEMFVPVIPDSIYHIYDTNYYCSGQWIFLPDGAYYQVVDTATFQYVYPTKELGCDSTEHHTYIATVINTSILDLGNALRAIGDTVSIHWRNCLTGQNYYNETEPLFYPSANGEYAYYSWVDGCRSSSECIEILGINVDEHDVFKPYEIYPNPAHLKVVVNTKSKATISVIQSDGKKVLETEVTKGISEIGMDTFDSGMYFFIIESNSQTWTESIIIRH